jgi:hypothetical protein
MALVNSDKDYLDGLAGDYAVGTTLAVANHFGGLKTLHGLKKTPTGIFLYCDYTGSAGGTPSLLQRLNFHTPGKSNEVWPVAASVATAFGAGWNALWVAPYSDAFTDMASLLSGDVVNAFVPPIWSVEFQVTGTGTINFNSYFMYTF